MGNKASMLFGAGPQNVLSDSEEHGHEVGTENSNNATPVALSAEEQADAKRYSELFGGKPKVKSSAGGGGSSKRKAGSRQKKKKQRFDGNHVEGEQGDAGGDGDESAPGSPYRGKAAWAVGTAATGHGKAKECAPQALSEEERQQQVIEAVEAKIEDLEKEKSGEDADEGAAAGSKVVEQALVADGGKGSATVAARERAAVENALFAGSAQNPPAEDALLEGPSGASVKGGAGGAGVVNDLPPTTARTASAHPPPQRDHKRMT